MTIAEVEATRTNTRIGRRPTRGAWWVVFKQELVEAIGKENDRRTRRARS